MKTHQTGYIILTIVVFVILSVLAAACGHIEETPPVAPETTISAEATVPVLPTVSDLPSPSSDTVNPSTPMPEAPTVTDPVLPALEDPLPSEQQDNDVVVPAQTSADDSFFSDAVFVGNSLVDGLYLYGGITTCDWLSGTGVSIYNIATQKVSDRHGGECTVEQGLSSKQYGKVYLLLGINEIGASPDSFKSSYLSILNSIRSLQPSADIYVMSLTPVTSSKSAEGGYFTKDNVVTFNNILKSICSETGCWYLDDYSMLADSSGFLPDSITSDGIHLTVSGYSAWMDGIRQHYVVH